MDSANLLTIEEARPIAETAGVTGLSEVNIALYLTQGKFNPAIAKAMREVLAAKAAVEKLSQLESGLDTEQDGIFDDQQRLRENIKSLKGTPEEKPLLQRYTQRLMWTWGRYEIYFLRNHRWNKIGETCCEP